MKLFCTQLSQTKCYVFHISYVAAMLLQTLVNPDLDLNKKEFQTFLISRRSTGNMFAPIHVPAVGSVILLPLYQNVRQYSWKGM